MPSPGALALVRRYAAGRLRRGQAVVFERLDERAGWSGLPPLDDNLRSDDSKRWDYVPDERVLAA